MEFITLNDSVKISIFGFSAAYSLINTAIACHNKKTPGTAGAYGKTIKTFVISVCRTPVLVPP